MTPGDAVETGGAQAPASVAGADVAAAADDAIAEETLETAGRTQDTTTAELMRSLQDLEREHADGELAEEDYLALRERYVARVAERMRSASGDPGSPGRPARSGGPGRDHRAGDDRAATAALRQRAGTAPARSSEGSADRARKRRIWRVRGVVAGLVVFAIGAVVIVATSTGSRLPGESVSGGLSLSTTQRAGRLVAQANVLSSEGKQAQALATYQEALAFDPADPAALLGSGWLERLAGNQTGNKAVAAAGRKQIAEAVSLDPQAPEGHLLLGTVLYQDVGDVGDAVTQFRLFLALHPPASAVRAARPVITGAFHTANEPVPAALGR